MDEKVKQALRNYLNNSGNYDIIIVWKAKIIQNWKYLLITDSKEDYNYYEITYNGDKNELYIDVYEKIDKEIIRNFLNR